MTIDEVRRAKYEVRKLRTENLFTIGRSQSLIIFLFTETFLRQVKNRIHRSLILLSMAWGFLCLVAAISSVAGAEEELGFAAKYQALLDVKNGLVLMNVASHPDDEDGATLAYYRRKYGIATHLVLATWGEGGQNEIGPELYEDLAVIRVEESLRASEVIGAQLHCLNLLEFGYSRSAEEAFAYWGRGETVRRLVRAIRTIRPDVIITNHDMERGHGQHRAIGIALFEAFSAAADSERFPEQGPAWQAQRLFLREAPSPTIPSASGPPPSGAEGERIEIFTGEYEPVRGKRYVDLAHEALALHASQGMAIFASSPRGAPARRYRLWRTVDEREGLTGLMDGLDTAPFRVREKDLPALGSEVLRRVSEIRSLGERIDTFDLAGDDRNSEILLTILGEVGVIRESLSEDSRTSELLRSEAGRLEKKIHRALARIQGLRLQVALADETLVPGQETVLRFELWNYRTKIEPGQIVAGLPRSARLEEAPEWAFADGRWRTEAKLIIDSSATATVPRKAFLNTDEVLSPWGRVRVPITIDGHEIELSEPVNLDIYPPITIEPGLERVLAIAGSAVKPKVPVRITRHEPGEGGIAIESVASGGIEMDPPSVELSFDAEDESLLVEFSPKVPRGARQYTYPIALVAASQDEGIPEATFDVHVVEVVVPPDLNVGLVRSYNDVYSNLLPQLGIQWRELTKDDLAKGDLAEFDTIVVDIRAYLYRQDLRRHNSRLLDYVRNGGHLIVLYQKTFEWNEEFGNPAFAPYPLHLSKNRVTREDSPVTKRVPEHALFSFPNRIRPQDWRGWRHERGLYFPDTYDESYVELLDCADPGEETLRGGLLVAELEKGTYVYTCLSWYRQLRELHPGALRLFANLISYPKRPSQ